MKKEPKPGGIRPNPSQLSKKILFDGVRVHVFPLFQMQVQDGDIDTHLF